MAGTRGPFLRLGVWGLFAISPVAVLSRPGTTEGHHVVHALWCGMKFGTAGRPVGSHRPLPQAIVHRPFPTLSLPRHTEPPVPPPRTVAPLALASALVSLWVAMAMLVLRGRSSAAALLRPHRSLRHQSFLRRWGGDRLTPTLAVAAVAGTALPADPPRPPVLVDVDVLVPPVQPAATRWDTASLKALADPVEVGGLGWDQGSAVLCVAAAKGHHPPADLTRLGLGPGAALTVLCPWPPGAGETAEDLAAAVARPLRALGWPVERVVTRASTQAAAVAVETEDEGSARVLVPQGHSHGPEPADGRLAVTPVSPASSPDPFEEEVEAAVVRALIARRRRWAQQQRAADLPHWQLRPSVAYSAVRLSPESRRRLLGRFRGRLPPGWPVRADHVTVCMGPLWAAKRQGRPRDAARLRLGQRVSFSAEAVGQSQEAVAVLVTGVPSVNARPHVTLAIHPGGRPASSNAIRHWWAVPPLLLRGTVAQYHNFRLRRVRAFADPALQSDSGPAPSQLSLAAAVSGAEAAPAPGPVGVPPGEQAADPPAFVSPGAVRC